MTDDRKPTDSRHGGVLRSAGHRKPRVFCVAKDQTQPHGVRVEEVRTREDIAAALLRAAEPKGRA